MLQCISAKLPRSYQYASWHKSGLSGFVLSREMGAGHSIAKTCQWKFVGPKGQMAICRPCELTFEAFSHWTQDKTPRFHAQADAHWDWHSRGAKAKRIIVFVGVKTPKYNAPAAPVAFPSLLPKTQQHYADADDEQQQSSSQ